jgi:hypothetical protein
MFKKTKSRIALIATLLFMVPCLAAAEQAAITKSTDLNCQTIYPPIAAVTNLLTGQGIRLLHVDLAHDQVPPCTGDLPPPGITIGPGPLPVPIPQLVKIRSSGGECSGALIAQNAAITAGHCVFDQISKSFYKNVQVIPGYQSGSTSYGAFQGRPC